MERLYLNTELFKKIIHERGLTEKALAEKMDISVKRLHFYLNHWEQKRVNIIVALKFANALDLSFNELITTSPPKTDK